VVDPETYKASTGTVSVVQAAQFNGGNAPQVGKAISVGLAPPTWPCRRMASISFVANANNDNVSVIDTDADQVVETIPTSLRPAILRPAAPTAWWSPETAARSISRLARQCGRGWSGWTRRRRHGGHDAGRRADPNRWFPLGVTLSRDGADLYVANSKGIGSLGPVVKRPISQGAAMPQGGPGGALGSRYYTGHSVYAVMGSVA